MSDKTQTLLTLIMIALISLVTKCVTDTVYEDYFVKPHHPENH